ncbi:hypothetical protein [Pseudomonas putida]
MNMKLTTRYTYPQRNKILEREIDRLLATESRTVQSLEIYLDALQDLLDKYHEEPAGHTLRNLSDYILKDNIDLSFPQPCYYLDSKHQKYLTETAEYTRSLKNSLQPKRANPWGMVDLIASDIELLIRRDNATNAEINQFVRTNFKMHPDYDYIESGSNCSIRLYYPEAIIYIVRSWEDFDLLSSRHSVSLIICIKDFTPVPDEVFSCGRLRTVSTLNQRGQFEEIWLRNPIDQCIRMVDSTLDRVRSKHSDYEHFIANLDYLLTELKSISLHTHLDIEPKGHLALEGIKTCFNLIQPLLNAASRLPNSEIIRTGILRLEQTALALSALSSNLSTRLNTKKYIINALDNMLRNDGLYRHKQKPRAHENAFSEENLNAILAGNLSCFYHHHKAINVLIETPMGAGRSDIVVKYEKSISALIEGKLIKQPNVAQPKVLEGLNQLYNRYGERISILDTFGVELYLILFAYDQESNHMSQATLNAIEEFKNSHTVDVQIHKQVRGHIHFSFVDDRVKNGFPAKKRSIHIFQCNMELIKKNEPDYRYQRKP